ncbi:MAG: hypothetical protein DLM52_11875 [Chthoniobacterales bacterium]|nr:MAG: hypothetical protein DLM52_11875 [Chthoniobacterales bacterium]
MTELAPAATESETIQWENFVKFVRQLSHDLRNQLNAAELQAALIGELTRDPELKPELLRLRELVSKLGTTLQTLTVAVAPPRPTLLSYATRDLVADLQQTITRDFPEASKRVQWGLSGDDAMLNIDPGLVSWAVRELFDNAFRHGKGEITAEARSDDGQFIFELREPKNEAVNPDAWRELLGQVQHGHYGFGLRRARAIVAAHGGELTSEWHADSSTLISRLIIRCVLPPRTDGSYNSTNPN